MEIAVKVETMNATFAYLATRPYSEVVNLIESLKQSRVLEPEPVSPFFHAHPNGGGLVHTDAVVHESAFIESGCIVMGAVSEGARVTGGSIIYPDDVIAEGACVHRLNCNSTTSKMHFSKSTEEVNQDVS
jgi:UDP-3-O-[3-hydroxymyristoyl] glucosamine N-acyltransferase